MDIHSGIWFTLMSLSILKAFYPPAFETIKWWSWQCHMKWTKRERGNVILITNGSLNCSAFDFSFLANLIMRIIFIRYAGPLGDDEISSVAHIYLERVVIHHASHLNHWFIWGLRFQGAIKILYLTEVVVLLIYRNCWLLSGLEWQIYCICNHWLLFVEGPVDLSLLHRCLQTY